MAYANDGKMTTASKGTTPTTAPTTTGGGQKSPLKKPSPGAGYQKQTDQLKPKKAGTTYGAQANQLKPGTGGPDPNVSADGDALVKGLTVAKGEQVVVLETSTSTTGIGRQIYFEPDTLYSLDMDVMFFRQLSASQGKGLLDLCTAGAAQKGDLLDVGGVALKGKNKQSVTFAIRATLNPRTQGYDSNTIPVQAANNGMLNVARLASAWLTAAPSVANKPEKLTILCKVTFGTDPNAADAESRKENVLTSVPPPFEASANATANALMMTFLGAFGFARQVDRSAQFGAAFDAVAGLDSARAKGAWAEQQINDVWHDTPARRSFVKAPLTGVADDIVAAVGQAMGAANAASKVTKDADGKDDYSTRDVHNAAFKNKDAVNVDGMKGGKRTLDFGVKDAVVTASKGVAKKIVTALSARLPAGMKSSVSPEFHKFVPTMAAEWSKAFQTAINVVDWDMWYAHHFQKNEWGVKNPEPGKVIAKQAGSGEGYVQNDVRLHRPQ